MPDGMLDFEVEAVGPFAMESWSSTQRVWSRHKESVWKPRSTAADAIEKCLTWTGLACIPAMRVIDLGSGEVVWQGSDRYESAGPSIHHPDEEAATTAARDVLSAMSREG